MPKHIIFVFVLALPKEADYAVLQRDRVCVSHVNTVTLKDRSLSICKPEVTISNKEEKEVFPKEVVIEDKTMVCKTKEPSRLVSRLRYRQEEVLILRQVEDCLVDARGKNENAKEESLVPKVILEAVSNTNDVENQVDFFFLVTKEAVPGRGKGCAEKATEGRILPSIFRMAIVITSKEHKICMP